MDTWLCPSLNKNLPPRLVVDSRKAPAFMVVFYPVAISATACVGNTTSKLSAAYIVASILIATIIRLLLKHNFFQYPCRLRQVFPCYFKLHSLTQVTGVSSKPASKIPQITIVSLQLDEIF